MAGLRSGNGEPSMSAFVRKPVVKGLRSLVRMYGPDLGDRWGTGKIGAASERCEIFTFRRRGQH